MKTYVHSKLYTNVHSGVIHNSQKVQITHTFIDWWVDRQDVVDSYNGIFFSDKKEWSADTTCCNMEETWKHPAKKEEKNCFKRPCIIWFPLHEQSRIGKFRGTGSGLVAIRGWVAAGWGDENVLELDGGDGCRAVTILKEQWTVDFEMEILWYVNYIPIGKAQWISAKKKKKTHEQ